MEPSMLYAIVVAALVIIVKLSLDVGKLRKHIRMTQVMLMALTEELLSRGIITIPQPHGQQEQPSTPTDTASPKENSSPTESDGPKH